MRLRARHYAGGEPLDLLLKDGIIQSVEMASGLPADHEADWVAPAWFDLQINGCLGHGFSTPHLNEAGIRAIVTECRKHGIGAMCPTLITNSFAILQHGLATIHAACESDTTLAAALPCIHLEGPYISPEDGPRGAHPPAHVRPPDWDEFRRLQDTAGGRIRLLTLSPEWPGSPSFIEKVVASGVVVAIGHTAAGPEGIHAAVRAGAKLSTHLGNGSHAMLPRHRNYLWEQLAADDLWASIICDGHHLPPSLVRCFLRVKGPERIILTCDAGNLAGQPPGTYEEWGQQFEILPEGKIVLKGTPFLGGSWAFTDQCIGNVMAFAGISLREAVDSATVRPRQLLGLPIPTLERGEKAHLVLFNHREGEPLRVQGVILA